VLFSIQIYSSFLRLKFYKGRREFADTGYIHDNTFAGGRMGLYVFSQAQVVWTDLSYRANGM
jgi:syndecan 4